MATILVGVTHIASQSTHTQTTIPTVKSIIILTLIKMGKKILYKINYTNTELNCMQKHFGLKLYIFIIQLLREIDLYLFDTVFFC